MYHIAGHFQSAAYLSSYRMWTGNSAASMIHVYIQHITAQNAILSSWWLVASILCICTFLLGLPYQRCPIYQLSTLHAPVAAWSNTFYILNQCLSLCLSIQLYKWLQYILSSLLTTVCANLSPGIGTWEVLVRRHLAEWKGGPHL